MFASGFFLRGFLQSFSGCSYFVVETQTFSKSEATFLLSVCRGTIFFSSRGALKIKCSHFFCLLRMFGFLQLPKLLLVLPFSLYSNPKNAATNDFSFCSKVVIQMHLFPSDSSSLKCLILFTVSISWRSQKENWKTFSQFSNFKLTFFRVQFYYPDHNRMLYKWRKKLKNNTFLSLVQSFDGVNFPKLLVKITRPIFELFFLRD